MHNTDEYENFETTLVITGKIWLDDERDWLEFIKKVEDLASNYNYEVR